MDRLGLLAFLAIGSVFGGQLAFASDVPCGPPFATISANSTSTSLLEQALTPSNERLLLGHAFDVSNPAARAALQSVYLEKFPALIDDIKTERIKNPWVLSKLYELADMLPYDRVSYRTQQDLRDAVLEKLPLAADPLQLALESKAKVVEPTRDLLASLDPSVRKLAATAEKLRSIDPRLAVLSLHPGITENLDNFIEFAKPLIGQPDFSALSALTAYKKKMGTVVYFRGLVLNGAEANEISRDGMKTQATRKGQTAATSLDTALRLGHQKMQQLHMAHSGAAQSPYMSVTSVIEVAQWVAKSTDENARYVFKVAVSRLDTVRIDNTETLVWAAADGPQILNRSFVQPERFAVDHNDVRDALRGR
jgi:hypothetical protein